MTLTLEDLPPRAREILGELAKLRHPEWVRDAAATVPDELVRAIVDDFSTPPTARAPSPIPAARGPDEPWRRRPAAVPLRGDPPGWSIIDAMLDADDRRWRAERRKEFEAAKGEVR
jgi:hypothetical protein